MEAPFAPNIVGSWLFIRSSNPEYPGRTIFHFTADGRCCWELDVEEKRTLLTKVRYRLAGGQLTLIFPDGREGDIELHPEDDGTIKWSERRGDYWIVLLARPEPYSIAFIDETGLLQRLSTPGSLP